jgi:hypothetical protein
MAGSPVKDEVDHRVKPDPAADSNASGVASIPPAHTADVNPVEPSFGNPSSVCNHHLEQLVSSSSVSELEAAVQVGARLLEDLKEPLNATQGAGDSQVAHWLQCIQQVEQKAKPARTVVGVVLVCPSVSAANDSDATITVVLPARESLVSSTRCWTKRGRQSKPQPPLHLFSYFKTAPYLLCCRLVPTSGMRACTASATEISYNHSDDPHELYQAEVEFISADDWSQELKTLLGDLIDGTGNISPDCYNPDTDAGLAYSRIRAVYPKKTRESIVRQASDPSAITAMARELMVHVVLGSVKRLRATSSPDLFEGLQQYIDSKENKEKSRSEMEYWRKSTMITRSTSPGLPSSRSSHILPSFLVLLHQIID